MAAFPASLHAVLLSLQGWRTYVTIVILSFLVVSIIGFLIERRKSSDGKIELAFFHNTLEIVSEKNASDIHDLHIIFRNSNVHSLYRSTVLITNMHRGDVRFNKANLPNSLRITIKDNRQIFDIRAATISDPSGRLDIDSPDQQNHVNLAWHAVGPDAVIRFEIFHSNRTKMLLSGQISGISVKSTDLGDFSMERETKDSLYNVSCIFGMMILSDYFEKFVTDHANSFGEDASRIIFILAWLAIVCRSLYSILHSGKKGRLLRTLKKSSAARSASYQL